MLHLDLQDLTAFIRGQASHRPPQPGSTDSGIDLCYADPTHVEVTQTKYHDLPSKATGHRPVEVQVKVLQGPPARTIWIRMRNAPFAPRKNTTHTG